MIKEIDRAIASGALSINKFLDKSRHRTRNIDIEHPEAQVYKAVRLQANQGTSVNTESELDDQSAIAIPVIFNDDLDEIDW